ncbi:MAG TPA: SDR family oxidoreductase [Steroidobacteraceae bacterium]|jgi:NAD(P)-dependent dehydrogenase (short-subunit alcohol dehydrogenase family)
MNETSRVVLLTGASSGFGHAIGAALARDGHRVFATSRASGAMPVPGATHLTLDVTDEISIAGCVEEVMRIAGRVDVLINNAGLGIAGAIEDTTIEEARAQFETNLFGLHRMCRAVLPHMRRQGGGHIINMSSLAGQIAIPFQGFYSASKFAIEGYSEALRMEARPYGIQVCMIEPGDFATAFTANRRMTAASTPASPYYERCEAAVRRMAHDEQANKDLSPVVDAVRAIIASERPALRYPRANAVQRVFAALRPCLPQAVTEYLIRSTYGLP